MKASSAALKSSFTHPFNKFATQLSEAPPKKLLLISIGNPSPTYDRTRHSAGHMALEYFIEHLGGLSDSDMHWDSSVELAPLKEHPSVYMAKSLEYMNASGRAYKNAMRKLGDGVRAVVLHDDMDTRLGVAKFKLESLKVGAHGGLSSIVSHYPGRPFARMQLGIGEPFERSQREVVKYVMKKLPPPERRTFEEQTLPQALEMIQVLVKTMSKKHRSSRSSDPAPSSA